MVVSLSFSPEERGEVLLDLGDGNGGEEFNEEKKEKQKHAEGSHGNAKLHPAEAVKTPVIGEEVLGHGADDDYKAFGIHADIDEDRDDEERPEMGSNLLEEKKKRGHGIAKYHDPK